MSPINQITAIITEIRVSKIALAGKELSEWVAAALKGQIDHLACFLDVDSSYPGRAEAAKGGAVRPLKGNVSWV